MVSKKGSKSKTNAKKTETPVEVAAPVEKVAKKVSKQAGGAKKVAAKKAAPKKAVEKQAGGAKKVAAKKTAPKKAAPKKAAPKKQGGGNGVETTKTGKVVRSFKVQLPGSEEYTGRFTGSTPYQAANKALSKYFRTEDNPKAVITFTIRESTRGSKHNTYTYEGHRIKLETPVSYTIGDGNTITKHHKNQLKKIKKADVENKESL